MINLVKPILNKNFNAVKLVVVRNGYKVAIVNRPDRKLLHLTSVQCNIHFFLYKIFGLPQTLVIIRKIIFSLKSCPLLLVFYGSTFHMKQRWHCCQSCIRRTCGPQNRPLRTDLKQTEATLLLL